jgi:hypothetical protein
MFGWSDLKEQISVTDTNVECPVKQCQVLVPRQRRVFQAVDRFHCRDHRIFVTATSFKYASERDNMLWTDEDDLTLWDRIKAPGVKRECRLDHDNSEDAVTWNVFRFLERQSLIARFTDMIAGAGSARNPHVIYWSLCQRTHEAWELLLDAVTTFGEVAERRSEPDIVIDDDELLIFCENKWLSANETNPSDPDNTKLYLTGGDHWFRNAFGPGTTFQKIAVEERLYELMRLWLIGSWIAHQTGKQFFLVNVVRQGANRERDIEDRVRAHLPAADRHRFIRLTWEGIHSTLVEPNRGCLQSDKLTHYLKEKTMGYCLNRRTGRASLKRALWPVARFAR